MDAGMLRLVRAVLPVYHGSARPLDLFAKENPEVLDLAVEKPFGGWPGFLIWIARGGVIAFKNLPGR